jgi:hypothetical protein
MAKSKEVNAMPIVHVPVHLTIEQLLAAVKQLSPDELREFAEEFAAWQKQHDQPDEAEAALLAVVEENSRLPPAEQRRFNRLRRKHQAETLTKPEAAELQALWRRVERMNVARLEALTTLAKRRGTDVRTCMRGLGLSESPDVFLVSTGPPEKIFCSERLA